MTWTVSRYRSAIERRERQVRQYHVLGYTDVDMARLISCRPKTVAGIRRRLGLPPNHRVRYKAPLGQLTERDLTSAFPREPKTSTGPTGTAVSSTRLPIDKETAFAALILKAGRNYNRRL